MRRIALLSVVTFLAACGSSTGSGNVRFANLSPDVVAAGQGIDFCIVPTGSSFTNATGVLASLGPTGATGLVYGGDGSKMVSKYFSFTEGNYDVKPTPVGTSCAASTWPIQQGSVDKGGSFTAAVTGLDAIGNLEMNGWKDTPSVATGKVAARFLNVGFVQVLGNTITIPAFDIVEQLAGGWNTLVAGLDYGFPGFGTNVDANGYLVVVPSSITGALYSCPTGTNPDTAQGQCMPLDISGQISGAANVVASAFAIGIVGAPPNFLFCADNAPTVAGQVYSLCTTDLTPPQ